MNSFTNLEFVLVPDDSAMTAPAFTEGLKDLKVKDGEPLSLRCVVTGDPDPQIEWFKNDEVLKCFVLFIIFCMYKNFKIIKSNNLCPYLYICS